MGERWTCDHHALMVLRKLVDLRLIACVFKNEGVVPAAVCWVENIDTTRWMLQEGWAELADGITDQAYVNAPILARAKKVPRS